MLERYGLLLSLHHHRCLCILHLTMLCLLCHRRATHPYNSLVVLNRLNPKDLVVYIDRSAPIPLSIEARDW